MKKAPINCVASSILLVTLAIFPANGGLKKIDPQSSSKLPNPASYFQEGGDQLATESRSDEVSSNQLVPEGRFGYTTTTGLGAVGATSLFPGLNTGTLKLDLGGLLLGAAIGFGAVIVLPKLLHILDVSPHGGWDSGYRRSEENSDGPATNNLSTENIVALLSRVDSALARHNVDSSSCVQRLVCSQLRISQNRLGDGAASTWDEFVASIAGNSVVDFLLDGTSIKQAVEMGRTGGDCDSTYAHCPFNKDSILAAIKGLLPDQQSPLT